MSEWISVKDRMPPRNGNYLVVTEGLGFFRGCTDIKILYFYNGCFKLGDKDVYSVNITHWMPLPDLPKPKEQTEHETTTFEPQNEDCRGYADTFKCTYCDCFVTTSHYMRVGDFDYEYCPYCGRPVEEEPNELR